MSALTKNLYVPFLFAFFAAIPGVLAVYGLRTGVIWRGGGREPIITLAKDAPGFYGTICFLSLLTLIFLSGAVWTTITLIRHKRK